MSDIEELKVQLGEGLNLTRVVEIKSGSKLLIVCRTSSLSSRDSDNLRGQIEEALNGMFDNQPKVIITNFDFELDFYRIDNDQ